MIRASGWLCCVGLFAGCTNAHVQAYDRAPSPAGLSERQQLQREAADHRAAALEAEQLGTGGMFRELQLRGTTPGLLPGDDGDARVAARLRLERPFRLSAERDGLSAERDAVVAEGDAAATEGDLELCRAGVQAQARTEERDLFEPYQAALREVLRWAQEWEQAGSLDPVSALRARLFVERHLIEDEPAPLLQAEKPLRPMPEVELAPSEDLLDLRADTVMGKVSSRPHVAAHLARARRHQHLATAERRSRMPWFDFVELGTTLDAAGEPATQARVAISIPLADGARGRAEGQVELERAERLSARARALELGEIVVQELRVLSRFELRAAAMRNLLTLADLSEKKARSLLEARADKPEQVAQLLRDAHAARVAVLRARKDAGSSSCVLSFAAGTSYEQWPRVRDTQGPGRR